MLFRIDPFIGNRSECNNFFKSATPENYSTIRPLLVNYTATDLAYIDGKIAAGCIFYLPENGGIPYYQKNMIGYVILDNGGIGMIIGGKYGGVYCRFNSRAKVV